MFKKILTALLTVTFTVMLFGCSHETEGNVSDVSRAEELSRTSDESDVSGENSESSSDVAYEYDSDGRVIKKITYGSYNEVENYVEYEYDDAGRCCKEMCFYYDGMLYYTDIREFDDDGKETVTLRYFVNQKNPARYECYYDDNGKLSKKLWLYPDGGQHNEEIYDSDGNMVVKICSRDGAIPTSRDEFNKNGDVVKHINYDYYGGVTSTTEYTYDEKLQETGIKSYDGEGNITYTMKFKYDDSGNAIYYCSEFFDADGNLREIIVTEQEYDSNGNRTKFVYTGQVYGEVDSDLCIEYFYNDDGNLIKEVSNKLDEATRVTIYEYDEYGRVIKETSRYEGNDIATTYVTVIYHDSRKSVERIYIDSDGFPYSSSECDENGMIIARTKYYSNGRIKEYVEMVTRGLTETIQYDAEGKVLRHDIIGKNSLNKETKRIIYDSNGNIIEHEENEYNMYGRVIKTIVGPVSDSSEVRVYEYNWES